MKKKKTFIVRAFIIATEIIMIILSESNDNIAFYILLPITLIVLWLVKHQEKIKSFSDSFFRIIKITLIIIILGIVLINIPYIKDIFHETVSEKIEMLFSNAGNTRVVGGSERFAIFFNALNQGYGWQFGKGLGYTTWFGGKTIGFAHFGLSDIGSFTTLGGIWFYLLFCCLYSAIGAKLITRKNKMNFLYALVLIYILVITIYSNVFVVTMSALWIFMLFLALGEYYKYEIKSDDGEELE